MMLYLNLLSIQRRKFGAIGLVALFILIVASPISANSEVVRFVALGDVPYGTRDNPTKKDDEYRRLVSKVNALKPAFTFHVGDTKSGSSSCTNAMLEKQLGFMNRYEMPLVYTPGDNEWSDCNNPATGKTPFEPAGRLDLIRTLYFSDARSLGQNPTALVRQPQLMPQHAVFSENARFMRGDVLFVTLHTVGDDNNYDNSLGNCNHSPDAEFCRRQAANIDWLQAAFNLAEDNSVTALVVATHADVLRKDSKKNVKLDHHGIQLGFSRLVAVLTAQAMHFGRPVLLIHGDKHKYTVDKPFNNADGSKATSITRLRVPGKKLVQAVQVVISPPNDPAFTFEIIEP